MRFGLVGTGHWARTAHATGLSRHTAAQLVGVWGRSHAPQVAAEFGITAYPTFDALLEDVDAVSFAVPPDVQAALAVRAARRGRHLLLDKPVALDVAAADRVAAAVQSTGVAAAVLFSLLYEPTVAAWLSARADTTWMSARIRMYASLFADDSPYRNSRWRRERGALWDLGPHAMAVALHALGPVESVVARRGAGDAREVIVRHTGGATTTMSLSLTAPAAVAGSDWTFYGPSGVESLPVPDDTASTAYAACLDDLLQAAHGGATRCDVDFGIAVVRALAAAEHSAHAR